MEKHADNGNGGTIDLWRSEGNQPSQSDAVHITVPGVTRLAIGRKGYGSIENYVTGRNLLGNIVGEWTNQREFEVPELQAHQRLLQQLGKPPAKTPQPA